MQTQSRESADGQPVDFVSLKLSCNGMLSPKAYAQIHRLAAEAPTGAFVEVGTAHGAATVAMALAMRQRPDPGRIYTFDRLEGGSREKWGTREDNAKIVAANFKRYAVDDLVEMHIGEVENLAHVVPADTPISMLVLDADGMIDRDLAIFYNSMPDDGVIVIDDCADAAKISVLGNSLFSVDLKHKLTFELLAFFQEEGLLEISGRIGETVFARKPAGKGRVDFQQLNSITAYRRCIRSTGGAPRVPARAKRRLYAWMQDTMPGVLRFIYSAKLKLGRN